MSTDFTVISSVRQHFGDEATTFNDIEPGVSGNSFVKGEKTFTFPCPNVDPNQTAVLMFQSRDVSKSQKNIFEVNKIPVFGGLPASPDRNEWNGNILLLEKHHGLKATGNTLHVKALNNAGTSSGDIDDFILDNIVVMYKTRTPLPTNQL
jgi:hypothetical protein